MAETVAVATGPASRAGSWADAGSSTPTNASTHAQKTNPRTRSCRVDMARAYAIATLVQTVPSPSLPWPKREGLERSEAGGVPVTPGMRYYRVPHAP